MTHTSLVGEYIRDVKTRPTTINWKNFLKSIVDGYERHNGIVHGVQKDAIQNGWDARRNKKGKGWKFTFELVETIDRTFLLMVDEGTYGLTGKILNPSDFEKDLPEKERWGRFENLAFTKEQSKERATLGSRGRGKFIFVGASKINEILYDSLRRDGSYRFGVRNLTVINSETYSWDEQEAKVKLLEMTSNTIKPLDKTGTRVIIVDPIDELVESVKNGDLLRNISETWWEIILKHDAEIYVKYMDKIKKASIPKEFMLAEQDDDNYLTWIIGHNRIKIGLQEFTVKKLHIIYNKNSSVPEDIRGVAIQRGGMKVCSKKANHISYNLSKSIYGYITLDKDSEYELHKYEDPEHYSFSRRAYPKSVETYIENQIQEFARKKLGWGTDQRAIKRQRTRNAERKALAAINDVATKLGLTGIGIGRRGGGGGGYRPARPIRLRMPELMLPRHNDLRVNYKESVKNIGCEIINDSNQEIKVRIKIYLRFYEKLINVFFESDEIVNPSSKSDFIGPFEYLCSKDKLVDIGEYTIVSRMVSLMETNRGDILDEKKKKFYLESEPPSKGLFEDCDGIKYPEEVNYLLGQAIPGSFGGWILQYNIDHSEFKIIQDDEEDSANYLYRLMAHELCRIDVVQDNPKLFNKDNVDSPDYVLSKLLELLGVFSNKYYTS